MKQILILNTKGYPKAFEDVEIDLEGESSKKEFIERRIIDAINLYNNKLNIETIVYDDLESQFEQYLPSNKEGAICEEFEINENEISYYEKRGYYTYKKGKIIYARHILEYVFLTPPTEAARNTIVSQTIFPTLIDYMNEFLQSPSYTPADHNIMIINIINKCITANSILRPLSALYAIGLDYVEVFDQSVDISIIPKTLKKFLAVFDPDFENHYNYIENTYEYKYYKINFNKKDLIIKKDELEKNIVVSGNIESFHGSSEKYFWIEVYPIVILAFNDGYNVDIGEYVGFIDFHKNKFSDRSNKMKRCIYLKQYLEKYFSVR